MSGEIATVGTASRALGRCAQQVRSIDPKLAEMLGPPRLLPGEDKESYDELCDRVRRAFAPEDVIEELLVADFVGRQWELLRLRRLKARFMAGAIGRSQTPSVVPYFLRPKHRSDDAGPQAEHDPEDTAAAALVANLGVIERIDALIDNQEARRNAVLREVDRHRARRLREAVTDIEDAEFVDVVPPADQAAA